jgi:hypothetical protein
MRAAGNEIRHGYGFRIPRSRSSILVAGSLATAAFHTEVLAEPSLAAVRLVAATVPGPGGTRAAGDPGIENYARLTR